MLIRRRILSVLTTASYLLAITVATQFHSHGHEGASDCCGHGGFHATIAGDAAAGHSHGASGENHSGPKSPAPRPADNHDCPVCQFLAQKPAPTAEVALVSCGVLVQEAFFSAPARMVVGVFSAWQSRAPPVFA